MLTELIKSTFCHLPEIGFDKELSLWRKGIKTWDDLLSYGAVYWDNEYYLKVLTAIEASNRALKSKDIDFFLKVVPESEWYRLYPDFYDRFYFLDIETEGLHVDAELTCFSILYKNKMNTFSIADGFIQAEENLNKIKVLLTFNGTNFDIPRLQNKFPGFTPLYHIDLMQILRAKGFTGGLKDLAKCFGWKSKNSEGVIDGAEAAKLYNKYKNTGNKIFIDELVSYNKEDVLMLQFLARRLNENLRIKQR